MLNAKNIKYFIKDLILKHFQFSLTRKFNREEKYQTQHVVAIKMAMACQFGSKPAI